MSKPEVVHFDVYNHKTTGPVSGVVRQQHGTNTNAVFSPGFPVRRVTPVECERLMGFPDEWTAIPWRGRPAAQCPEGLRYKALSNSMAVNCMRFIGERIALVDATFAELEAAAQVEERVP